jgi:hypothetical protein
MNVLWVGAVEAYVMQLHDVRDHLLLTHISLLCAFACCCRLPPLPLPLLLLLLLQMVIGGTNINRERSDLRTNRCDMLIATPGRLTDHLDSTPGFAGRLWGVQVGVVWLCCSC